MGLLAGVVAHTGIVASTRFMEGVIVALMLSVQPILAPLIGWGFGVANAPGSWALVGGGIVISGIAITVIGAWMNDRKPKQHASDCELTELENRHSLQAWQ